MYLTAKFFVRRAGFFLQYFDDLFDSMIHSFSTHTTIELESDIR
jgi:hypothetical protein